MAWVADAQALATANAGPRSPRSIEIWLAGAFAISFGIVSGWTRGVALLVEPPELVVVGRLAADADADDGRRPLRQSVREIDAGLRDRLARRDHRELRHAVHHRDLAVVEIFRRIVVLNFRDRPSGSVPRRTEL